MTEPPILRPDGSTPSAGGIKAHRPSHHVPFYRSGTTIIALAVIAIAAALVGGVVYFFQPIPVRIAVGPPGSDDVKVVQAIAQAFSRDRSRIRIRIIQTDGVQASAEAVDSGKADMAVLRDDVIVPKSVATIATMRKNFLVVWAPSTAAADKDAAAGRPRSKAGAKGKADKDEEDTTSKKTTQRITAIKQLAGHRVAVIGRTQANINLLKMVLDQYSVPFDSVRVVQIGVNEVADSVRKGVADVFVAVGPVTSRITAEAIALTTREVGPPSFIAIGAAEAIAQKYPIYEAVEISSGAFGGVPPQPEESVQTISVPHHLVARKSLSDVTVADFTRELFSIRPSIVGEFPYAASIQTPDTDKDAAIPAHPGAAAYVDGEEKTFLDRYSDMIWWTIMGASAIGSIGAWLSRRLRKDAAGQPGANKTDLLLHLLTAARAANTTEELDGLQAQADAILRAALPEIEEEQIEEPTLRVFSLVLHQVHDAIADRRVVLDSIAMRDYPAVAPHFDPPRPG